jgi:citrate synthase
LEDIVASDSGICLIDGDAGVLAYRGIDIHELAEKSTFPETAYLLWFGRLPSTAELADFNQKLTAARALPPDVVRLLEELPKDALPMAALRTAVSALSMYDADQEGMSPEANVR